MYDFHFPGVFLITFSKRNGRAEVEENNSNDTLVSDDDAHKVVLCTGSHISLLRLKEDTSLWKNSETHKTDPQALQRNGENHILGQNSNFWKKNPKFSRLKSPSLIMILFICNRWRYLHFRSESSSRPLRWIRNKLWLSFAKLKLSLS